MTLLSANLLISFYLRDIKENKNYSTIYCRIKINSTRKAYSTGLIINKTDWDPIKQRIYNKSIISTKINNELNSIYYKLNSTFEELNNTKGYVFHEDLKVEIINQNQKNPQKIDLENPLLFDLIERYKNDLVERFDSKNISYSSKRSYLHSIKIFESFFKMYYTTNSFRLKDTNRLLFSEFEAFLKRKRGLNNNTTNKTARHILSIINYAHNQGWINYKPFILINTKYKNPIRKILTFEEIKKIEKIVFDNNWDNEARDIALFQIYTGLAYSEVKELKENHIKEYFGKKWIVISRKKTGNESKVVLLPIPLKIIDKYKNHEYCIKMNQLLPITSNPKYNGRLKKIQKSCKIETKISSHILRHTFSTTIALSMGLSMESLSKVLGHTSLKTTAIYGKIMDRRIFDEFERLEIKLSNYLPL